MKIIEAKFFKTRTDLENHVRNNYGLTPEPKPKVEIQGTRADLARLHLSDRSVFWGIICTITDTPTEPQSNDKPDRGPQRDFGINLGAGGKAHSIKEAKKTGKKK